MEITITTFNVENLFNRYAMLDEPWEGRSYEKVVMAVGLVSVADRQGALVSYDTTHIQRNNTAMAILDAQPDILAVSRGWRSTATAASICATGTRRTRFRMTASSTA